MKLQTIQLSEIPRLLSFSQETPELARRIGQRDTLQPGQKDYGNTLRCMFRMLTRQRRAVLPFNQFLYFCSEYPNCPQFDDPITYEDGVLEFAEYVANNYSSDDIGNISLENLDKMAAIYIAFSRMPNNIPIHFLGSQENPIRTLTEDSIIRKRDSRYEPIEVLNIYGNNVAYLGDVMGSNWGDSILIPRDEGTFCYTDFGVDCPSLAMLLKDLSGREYIFLSHVYQEDIDGDIAHAMVSLKARGFTSEKVVFSPRTDSEYSPLIRSKLEGLSDEFTFHETQVTEFTGPKSTLVTPDGYCIVSGNSNEDEPTDVKLGLW